jgi:thiol-disulfide isomerase/thioredoxin
MAMTFSPSSVCGWILSLAVLVGVLPLAGKAAPADKDPADNGTAEVVVSDAPDFTVPDGDAATLLAFIEKLAFPTQQFTSQAELQTYLEHVAPALSDAADKILASAATDQQLTDRQLIDAIEWKVESLRLRGQLGDEDADKQTDEFLASLKFPARVAVDKAIENVRQNRAAMQMQVELMTKLRSWPRLTAAQRTETTDWLINAIKTGGATGAHAHLLMMFSDTLSDTPDSGLAKQALDELLPLLRASDSPGVERLLPRLEGLSRRLNLLGSKLELAGTLLDGKKLDWDSYRGKVVLVDFWATWCQPCRAEVPNVLENYLKYHNKGFDVVGISLDEQRSDAEEYVAQTNIPWPSLFHEASGETGWQSPMAVKYGITGIPTAILVDQEGNVVSTQARGPRLGAALEKLLGKPSETKTSNLEISDRDQRTAQSEGR